jgi:hypothetical protein
MRTMFVATTAVIAIAGIVFASQGPRQTIAEPASAVSVMDLMTRPGDLPMQSFEAI